MVFAAVASYVVATAAAGVVKMVACDGDDSAVAVGWVLFVEVSVKLDEAWSVYVARLVVTSLVVVAVAVVVVDSLIGC